MASSGVERLTGDETISQTLRFWLRHQDRNPDSSALSIIVMDNREEILELIEFAEKHQPKNLSEET